MRTSRSSSDTWRRTDEPAQRLVRGSRAFEQIAAVQSAQVYLVSQIGKPTDEPQVVDVKIAT